MISCLQVRVEYSDIPPQVFISELNAFIRDHQPPRGFRAEISWERMVPPEEQEQEYRLQSRSWFTTNCQLQSVLPLVRARDVPFGYRCLQDAPILRGPHQCPKCYCDPCVITRPPNFLRGSCDPHEANGEKRHRLYRKFWRCLNGLGVWRDEEYLRKKEGRTVRDDRRDIMPDCVLEVHTISPMHVQNTILPITGDTEEIPQP